MNFLRRRTVVHVVIKYKYTIFKLVQNVFKLAFFVKSNDNALELHGFFIFHTCYPTQYLLVVTYLSLPISHDLQISISIYIHHMAAICFWLNSSFSKRIQAMTSVFYFLSLDGFLLGLLLVLEIYLTSLVLTCACNRLEMDSDVLRKLIHGFE